MNSNQFCITTVLFWMISAAAIAQPIDFHSRNIISKYEITAGMGLLKSSTYYPNVGHKIGYSFGVGVSHVFSKSFELKARALYEFKGSKTETGGAFTDLNGQTTNITRRLTTNLYYLTLSVLPTFHLTKKKNVIVGAGGFYSFNTDAKIIEERTDNTTNTTTTTYYNGRNPWLENDLGVSCYGGYTFPLRRNKDLTLAVHYNKSLKDYSDVYSGWQRTDVILLSFTFGLLR